MTEDPMFEGICNSKCIFRETLVRRYVNRLAFIQSMCQSILAQSPALVYPPLFHFLVTHKLAIEKKKTRKEVAKKIILKKKKSFPTVHT